MDEQQEQAKADRGEKTAENVRYGQTISEGGMGGMTTEEQGGGNQGMFRILAMNCFAPQALGEKCSQCSSQTLDSEEQRPRSELVVIAKLRILERPRTMAREVVLAHDHRPGGWKEQCRRAVRGQWEYSILASYGDVVAGNLPADTGNAGGGSFILGLITSSLVKPFSSLVVPIIGGSPLRTNS